MLSTIDLLEGALSTLLTDCSTLASEKAPPILLTSATQRSERLRRLSEIVRDIDGSITRLRVLQEHIPSAMKTLVSYRNHVLQASSPISALPPEILSQIFVLACSDSKPITPKNRPSNKIIGATCARWRAIVSSIPKLCKVVDITATSTSSEISECARHAGAESLTLRLLGGRAPGDRVLIPESVMSRVSTVELTDGKQLDWLRLFAYHHSTPSLQTLCLSATSRGDLKSTAYHFSPNHFAHDFLLSARTLICQGISLSEVYDFDHDPNGFSDDDDDGGETRLCFSLLSTFKLEGQDVYQAYNNLQALYTTPRLTTLWTSRLTGAALYESCDDVQLTQSLSSLHVHGDVRNANATGILLDCCAEPKLQSLSLFITPPKKGKKALSWASICRIFEFSNKARSITIACSSSSLPDVVKALVRQNLPRLRVLVIALMEIDNAKVEEKLGGIKLDLVELVGSRTDRGLAPVEYLRISRTLLGDEDEWFAARVGTLEISDD